MVDELLRKFGQENFGHGYYTAVPGGEIEKVQPLALVIKKDPPLWKRPFKKSKIVVLGELEKFSKSKEEAYGFLESLKSKVKEEMFQSKQKTNTEARTKEMNASFEGYLEGAIRLREDQGVLKLGKLSQKYIDDPDVREILTKITLDAHKMSGFEDGYKLLLITEVIYSEKLELTGGKKSELQAAIRPSESSATRNHSATRQYGITRYFEEIPTRDSKAPILFRCCYVSYIKEENRLEISKGKFVGKSVL